MSTNYKLFGIRIMDFDTNFWHDDVNDNAEMLGAIIANLMLDNKVISGGEVTDGGGLTIDIAQTVAKTNGTKRTINSGSLSVSAKTDPDITVQKNFVFVNSSGIFQVATTLISSVFTLLAVVDTNETDIVAIYDARSIVTAHELVTQSADGHMSKEDKIKLDGITLGNTAGDALELDGNALVPQSNLPKASSTNFGVAKMYMSGGDLYIETN